MGLLSSARSATNIYFMKLIVNAEDSFFFKLALRTNTSLTETAVNEKKTRKQEKTQKNIGNRRKQGKTLKNRGNRGKLRETWKT